MVPEAAAQLPTPMPHRGPQQEPQEPLPGPRPSRGHPPQAGDAPMAPATSRSRAAVGSRGVIRDRAEEALASWPCRRRRTSEAQPEDRRRRDQHNNRQRTDPHPRSRLSAVPGRWGTPPRRRRGRPGGRRRVHACVSSAPTERPAGRAAAGVPRRPDTLSEHGKAPRSPGALGHAQRASSHPRMRLISSIMGGRTWKRSPTTP